jgi:uncharacterized membrane protein YbaN (DUF454 family)
VILILIAVLCFAVMGAFIFASKALNWNEDLCGILGTISAFVGVIFVVVTVVCFASRGDDEAKQLGQYEVVKAYQHFSHGRIITQDEHKYLVTSINEMNVKIYENRGLFKNFWIGYNYFESIARLELLDINDLPQYAINDGNSKNIYLDGK